MSNFTAVAPHFPLPDVERAQVVVEAPGQGPGNWAGSPSAVLVDGVFYLAYRVRRPVGEGRGMCNVVARSHDGVQFEHLATIEKDAFGAESLERPAITRTPSGTWQLYISCATLGTKHWWIDVLEAADPASFDAGRRRTVFPGDEKVAVKDPVVKWHDGIAHAWITCHPLEVSGAEDRMTTRLAVSKDTVDWTWRDEVLSPRDGHWDSRGARVTDVIVGDTSIAYYDGRATAEENFEERTGVAGGPGAGPFVSNTTEPSARSPHAGGGLRYLSVVPLPDGSHRLYFEASRSDGAHNLYTQLVTTG